jgi:ribosome-associated protein
MLDVSKQIRYQTARSGGKGGQNVNKVETMVEGYFHIDSSDLLTDEQKATIKEKLSNKINTEGYLLVKSQEARTQLANKKLVTDKIHCLLKLALQKQKKRRPTKPPKAAKENRLESKKRNSETKYNRRKISY